MKKVLCLLISMAMVMAALVACSSGAASEAPAASEAAASAPAEDAAGDAVPADAAGSDLKVAVLSMREMTQPADLSTLEGIQRLEDELGIVCNIVIAKEVAEYYDQMQAVCEEGYDVVYFIYDNFLEAGKELCLQYPDTIFIGLWIDMQGEEVAPNFKPVHFRSEQGAFMCGALAAKMTESGTVGFIGGGDNPGINVFLAGYGAGIDYVDNGTELVSTYANTFDDPLKGKELASSMYSRGADIIYQAANQTGLGVFEAAQESDNFAIGVDVDQSPLAPENIICSSLLDHGYATFDSIASVANGTFTNEQVFYGLQEGMPVIAINEAIVPAEVVAEVQAIEQEIIDGNIEIPTTLE